MITVTIPQQLADLSKTELTDIVNRIYHQTEYTEEYLQENRDGRYITVHNGDEIHYVCISKPDNDARNARLMQFVTPTYTAWYDDPKVNKFLDIYLSNPTDGDKNNYSKFFYRCFLTIGINILNIDQLFLPELVPFNNYFDLKHYRERNTGRNRHNRATYFSEEKDHIELFAKTFGANQMESFILALVLRQLLPDKSLILFPVVDNEARDIARKQREILIGSGVKFGETISNIDNRNIRLDLIGPERDTPKYHYNLLKKYGDKKCLLCGCEMEHLIIGSHIERVTDIKNSAVYSDEEKIRRIVDGENGFWLCANHDKMFEYGIIYFKDQKLCYRNGLRDVERNFINYSMMADDYMDDIQTPFEIPKTLVSEQMEEYLAIHRHRTGAED